MHADFRLEPKLLTRVIDIFIDWDFQMDRSVMVIIHQPIA